MFGNFILKYTLDRVLSLCYALYELVTNRPTLEIKRDICIQRYNPRIFYFLGSIFCGKVVL